MYLLKINVVEASYSFLYIPVPSNIYQYHFSDTLTPVVQNVVSVTKSLVEDSLILTVLAGDQWWPRTSGGRLRFAHAITHLLRHRFGHFINSNK